MGVVSAHPILAPGSPAGWHLDSTLPLLSTDAQRARIVLPLANLAPGTYVVRVDATAGDEHATQQVAFTVSQ